MPNLSSATLDALTDDQLMDLVQNMPTPAATTTGAADANTSGVTAMDDGDVPDLGTMMDDLVDAGYDPDQVNAMSDDEVLQAWQSLQDQQADSDVGQQAATFSEACDRAKFLGIYSRAKQRFGATRAARLVLNR